MLDHLIYKAVVGSHAYGLATPTSDLDVRGIYQAPAKRLWSLHPPPEQISDPQEPDSVFWELGKFLRLALKANPTILETLWTPKVLEATPFIRHELLPNRNLFLSKRLYATYTGYATQQLHRLRARELADHPIRWKHAAHCVRLLQAAIHALGNGEILVDVRNAREYLLSVKTGQQPLTQILSYVDYLKQETDEALRRSDLPEHPDEEKVNQLLLQARYNDVSNTQLAPQAPT